MRWSQNNIPLLFMQQVYFTDLGQMDYQAAWDYQEELLRANVDIKSALRSVQPMEAQDVLTIPGLTYRPLPDGPFTPDASRLTTDDSPLTTDASRLTTRHSLLFVEHPPVYTLGKSGRIENILISAEQRQAKGIDFFYTNRGGDITFHGPQQIVAYPILDLEKFYTDIGRYMRSLEEVIIRTLAEYNLQGERSRGETGVWLDAGIKGKERKIAAIGVRCSRWITMHGFAFNVNTDLAYFNNIIPCGIQNKQVTSLANELNRHVSFTEAKQIVKKNFEKVFDVQLI